MRMLAMVAVGLLVLASAACDSGKKGAAAPTKPASSAATPTSAAPGKRERDLSTLQLCEIVKGEEIVKIAGAAKLAAPPAQLPGGCMYVVEKSGGAAEGYNLRIESATMEAMVIDQLKPEDKMDNVPGPWDDARIGKQPLGDGLRLMVLRRNDLGIEVTGARKEPMIEIAKLAATRIK